jgi:hypothetical protein
MADFTVTNPNAEHFDRVCEKLDEVIEQLKSLRSELDVHFLNVLANLKKN